MRTSLPELPLRCVAAEGSNGQTGRRSQANRPGSNN
jgi:hypothetical protein